MKKSQSHAGAIALGGVMAALAVIFMCIGGIIPVATYAVPMLCSIMLQAIYNICGKSIAWAWFGAVAILSLLLSPDKEAAATFCFLGYYPIVKPTIDKKKFPWLWKGCLFNLSIITMYSILIEILGLQELSEEFKGMNAAMLITLAVMGNITFILLDIVLNKDFFRKLGARGK